MIKKKFSLFIGGLCLFISFISHGQENSIWYSFSLQGDKTKITELKDLMLYEQVREEKSPYPARVDTVDILKRLNDSTYIIFKPNREGDFALMASRRLQKGSIKSIGIYYPSENLEMAVSMYTKNGLPKWKELTTRWVFSGEKVSELEKAPGYDEVTREAILDALSIRQKISPVLKAYMEQHPDTKPFRMYRLVEVKAQHRFIELGYNPYKRVPYNFEKQFEGDAEVIKALTEPMSFENE
ncbi:MAG: hypothetical protein AAF039_02105 [Bacteroidota bacterium]